MDDELSSKFEAREREIEQRCERLKAVSLQAHELRTIKMKVQAFLKWAVLEALQQTTPMRMQAHMFG